MKTNHESKAAAKRYYSALAKQGKLSGTIKAAMAKWEARNHHHTRQIEFRGDVWPMAGGVWHRTGYWAAKQASATLRRGTPVRVRLSDALAADHLARCQRANPRLREWSLGCKSAVQNEAVRYIETGSNSDWSKRSTFQRGITIQSQATCTRQVATMQYYGDTFSVVAPRGYRWDIDANGLVLLGAAGDYHPNMRELLAAQADRCRGIVAALKTAAATRRAAKAKAQQQLRMLKLAEKEGATVCLADSKRAGNCVAGSKTWAEQHGLDPRKHYTPSEILAKANGDASRVAIVVAAAIRRHRAEMDRGYAILSEHRA